MYDKEKAEQYASVVFNRLNAFEQDTLEKIGKRIKEIGSMSAFDQQALKNMADISRDMDEITKELARVTELNIEDVQRIYTQVVEESGQSYKPLYDFCNMEFVPLEDNEYVKGIVHEWAKQTAETMVNLSRTNALCFVKEDVHGNVISSTPLEGAYQQIIDDAVTAVSTGTATFNQVMRRSIEQMGGSGIRVDYGDRITRNISSVIRSNILYGAKMATRSYDDYIGEELGCNGYEIDAHAGCRPSHIPIQGLICSMGEALTIDGITYPSFHDALEGGKSAADLMDNYGCLHIRDSVILGVSVPRYTKEELDRIYEESTKLIEFDGKEKTLYEWSQAQRRIENEVRREQNKRVIAKASGQKTLAKQCDKRIKTYRTVYDNLCNTVGLPNRTDRMAIFEGKRLDTKSGAVYNEGRLMANGGRKSPFYILTDKEISLLKEDIRTIGADESIFKFNVGRQTSYHDKLDIIKVCGDVLPDNSSTHPRDVMSSRAVLAHEYYGHRAYRNTRLPEGSWNDEFRASYMAAKNAPNLTDDDRRYLVLDALERAKEKGITIKHNDFIRRVLYGY